MLHPQAQRGLASAENAELQRRQLEPRGRGVPSLLFARLAEGDGEDVETPPETYQKRSRVETTRDIESRLELLMRPMLLLAACEGITYTRRSKPDC